MQFPSKNQKQKRRPNSEIHESETVCRVLVTATVAQSIVLGLHAGESTSQAENQPFALLLTISTVTYNISTYSIYLRKNISASPTREQSQWNSSMLKRLDSVLFN